MTAAPPRCAAYQSAELTEATCLPRCCELPPGGHHCCQCPRAGQEKGRSYLSSSAPSFLATWARNSGVVCSSLPSCSCSSTLCLQHTQRILLPGSSEAAPRGRDCGGAPNPASSTHRALIFTDDLKCPPKVPCVWITGVLYSLADESVRSSCELCCGRWVPGGVAQKGVLLSPAPSSFPASWLLRGEQLSST